MKPASSGTPQPLLAQAVQRSDNGRHEHGIQAPGKPIHVAFLVGTLSTGGAERQLLELLRGIDHERYRLSLVLFKTTAEEAALAAELVEEVFSLDISAKRAAGIRMRGIKAIKAVVRLTGFLRRTRPDVFHAVLPSSCILGVPAAIIAGVPHIVGSRRSLVDSYYRGHLLGTIDSFMMRRCDRAIGNSDAIQQELVTVDGVSPEKAVTIFNGVDIQRFQAGDRGLRREFGWGAEHTVFGIVANFIPYKRHIDFIRAAAIIAAAEPDARFVMAGEDRGILKDLEREIDKLALRRVFTIIPGTSTPERLFSAIDVYVCTSETEGLSNVLLEAAACELPIIATRVGGNPEIVRDGANGFLVDRSDRESIARRCIELFRDNVLRKRMGAEGRRLVESRFSMRAMVRSYEELYEQLISARRATTDIRKSS